VLSPSTLASGAPHWHRSPDWQPPRIAGTTPMRSVSPICHARVWPSAPWSGGACKGRRTMGHDAHSCTIGIWHTHHVRPAQRALSSAVCITRQTELPAAPTRVRPPVRQSPHDTAESPFITRLGPSQGEGTAGECKARSTCGAPQLTPDLLQHG
jgi:hypothetical protein